MTSKLLKIIIAVFFVLLLLVGFVLLLGPFVVRFQRDADIERTIDSWKESVAPEDRQEYTIPSDEEPLYPELLDAMKLYNKGIFENGQAGLVDEWSYQSDVFDLTEYAINDGVVGCISIPAINVEMPLYLGASYENLAKGFAQLSQTSMPIGGTDTNCVVACHRGYDGSAFLRDADQIELGDTVSLQNLWETLTYEVCKIQTIQPYEVEEVLIQEGRDMLTIVTCTPYRVGSHRLLIFCERKAEP